MVLKLYSLSDIQFRYHFVFNSSNSGSDSVVQIELFLKMIHSNFIQFHYTAAKSAIKAFFSKPYNKYFIYKPIQNVSLYLENYLKRDF